MRYQVVIPAAGSGRRIGSRQNKLLIKVLGKPLIAYTLQVFEDDGDCEGIILAVKKEELNQFQTIANLYGFTKIRKFVVGGMERQDSVRLGLMHTFGDGVVLIHDGARPFVSLDTIHRLVRAAHRHGAAIPAVPVKDTVKSVPGHTVQATFKREELWAAQTPQAFYRPIIVDAHKKAEDAGYIATDDASLVEWQGLVVHVEYGDYNNFKITTKEDITRARLYIHKLKGETFMRVGQGYDVHPFAENRPLIIGGVHIPYERGLSGHSDADVLLHAMSDALLGAIGAGDIGQHFPDTDPQYKGADSRVLLKKVWSMVKEHDYELNNIDAVIIAQAPKMAPFIPEMIKAIAGILECAPTQINIKATTAEKLGFVGREEGIAAQAVCLIENI